MRRGDDDEDIPGFSSRRDVAGAERTCYSALQTVSAPCSVPLTAASFLRTTPHRVGDIAFLANLGGGQTSQVVFTNVLHTPGIVTNLISVSRFDKNGCKSDAFNIATRLAPESECVLYWGLVA